MRYEPGGEAAAAVIARNLPTAIATIEHAQLRPFVDPVRIYVCAMTQSFARYGYGVTNAGGFVLNGRLFISPKPQNTPERLPHLVTHELSHLHLEQQLGTITFARALPGWFKEGLAVYVSGAGVETVSPAAATAAIVEGRVFRRETHCSLLFPQTGARDQLPEHLFYREGELFVAFLAREAKPFSRLLLSLEDGRAFKAALSEAYGRDLDSLWREFVAGLKAAPAPVTAP